MFLFFVISDSQRERLGALVAAVAGGDAAALSAIYEEAGGRLLSVAMGVTRNLAMAEDVLQDSFVKIARSAAAFRAGTNGYAWLCTVVRNTALNALKYERHRQGADIDAFFSLADVKDDYGEFELAESVRRGLKELTPEERTVIWLKYFNEMTVREIAAELNTARSTVQERIVRAEEHLRSFLK
jgi:RNA polymerase sigma-70 factor (ECF subfamily)